MSWRASAWAKEQRLGSPAAKSILLCLADSADADTNECWPSQSRLAEDAEVSERTAREWLQRLEEWGLIARTRRNRPNGARAADMIVLNLSCKISDGAQRCRDIKEMDGQVESKSPAVLPAEIAGRAYRQSDAGQPATGDHPTGNGRRASMEEPSIEPSNGTSQPGRASAAERGDRSDKAEDQKKIDAEGWALLKDWPSFAGMPKEPALKVWRSLAPDERAEAARKFPAWLALLKAQHKSHVPAPSTYLGQKLFREVPEPIEAKPAAIEARPFGKLWQAARLKLLLAEPSGMIPDLTWSQRLMVEDGKADEAELRREKRMRNGWPKVNALHEAASVGRSITASPTLEPLAALMVQIRVGGEEFEAWKVEHQLRGWPWLPDPGKQEWVYFPAGGPEEGLRTFEQAVRGNNADGSAQAAE